MLVTLTIFDCCEIGLSRLLTMNLDRLIGRMRDLDTKNHQKLDNCGIGNTVRVFRNSLILLSSRVPLLEIRVVEIIRTLWCTVSQTGG